MTEAEKDGARESFEKWCKTQPHCLGYPKCDGNLVGVQHVKQCPMEAFGKVANGANSMISFESCFKAGAAWQASQSAGEGWISVEERMPKEWTYVLAGCPDALRNKYYITYRKDGSWVGLPNAVSPVKFWMDLPDLPSPPKEKL